jgi:AraC-like DNA-binding protein
MASVHRPFSVDGGIPLVRVAVLEPIGLLFHGFGLNMDSIVRKGGFPRIPASPNDFYSYNDAVSILGIGAKQSGIEQMGLMLGKLGGLPSLGQYGDYIATAPTLYRAMLRASALIKWISPHLSLSLHREGSNMAWRMRHPCSGSKNSHHGYFHTTTLLLEVARRATSPDWVPEEIRIGDKAHAGAAIQHLFGAQVRYVEDEWAVVFPRRILIQPMCAWNQPAGGSTRESLMDSVIPPDFASTLTILIRSLLATRNVNEEMFARICGLSLRSFQRQLADNGGYRFREFVSQVRFNEAKSLLMDQELQINEVAQALGYSEQANFTRAFVRWVGMPPGEYRKHVMFSESTSAASMAAGAK